MDLTGLTIIEASRLLQNREISPVELTHLYLERIEALDPQINAFITVTPDLALAQAEAAQQDILRGETRTGEPLSPLHGIPFGLKDLYLTEGIRTTSGSKFFSVYIPERNAALIDRLLAAGAITLGKLNMHEIALGVTNVNPHFGACRNPWNPDHISGGSSGGSGAALAAGMCLGSLGSDTGGSIRIPASLCGIVGLKPSYGRVSLRGVTPLSWNLDHAGPMARTVRDAAIILQSIAGYDPHDPASANVPVDDYLTDLDAGVPGLRIAFATDDFFRTKTDPGVFTAIEAAARTFAELGAIVEELEFPNAYEAARTNGLMTVCDAAAFHHGRLQEHPEKFGADVLQRLQTGASTPITDYITARRTQAELRRQFEVFFEEYDILLTPTTPVAAPPIEGPDAVAQAARLTRFTAPFNLTGLPAISLPCGFTADDLPVGLQLVSRPWAERVVLQAAYAYEGATNWHERRPD